MYRSFLQAAYSLSIENPLRMISVRAIADRLGIPYEEAVGITDELHEQQMVLRIGRPFLAHELQLFLTHSGLLEVLDGDVMRVPAARRALVTPLPTARSA